MQCTPLSACSTDAAKQARVYTKGAAELVLDLCATRMSDDGSVTALTRQEKDTLLHMFGQDGNRSVHSMYRRKVGSGKALSLTLLAASLFGSFGAS